MQIGLGIVVFRNSTVLCDIKGRCHTKQNSIVLLSILALCKLRRLDMI